VSGQDAAAPRVEAIAFDLDGTLIDTAPDIAAALNRSLAAEGLPTVAAHDARQWIGDGPDMLIQRALEHLGRAATATLRAALRARFEAATLAVPMAHGSVFAGMPALLEAWCGRAPMVVVTNKPTTLSERVLEAAGVRRFFDAVHGADHPDQRKPAPYLLEAAAAGLGVGTSRLLMVGDSANDLRCARAAGCPAVWVAWGYGAFAPPESMDVMRVDTPAELGAAIAFH
jgi:phosphoglycolate phosphatase